MTFCSNERPRGRADGGGAEHDRARPAAGEFVPPVGGGTLTPLLELGVRQDGGDAETGAGLEAGGGLRYADPSSGVSMDLKARTLLAHPESGHREWGVSGALRIAPGASGRGLSLSLTPAYGADPAGRLGGGPVDPLSQACVRRAGAGAERIHDRER